MAVRATELRADDNLVLAAQAGDGDAFAELFRRHYDAVHRACVRRVRDSRDAEEMAQAAFARAWERLDRCAGERRFGGWVQAIAHNLCMDLLRTRARASDGDTEQTEAPGPNGPEEAVLQSEAMANVHAALKLLPPRQRRVVVARHLEDRRPVEIAAALGLSVGAVDSLLLRARRRLAESMGRLGQDGAASVTSASTVAGGAATSGPLGGFADTLSELAGRAAFQIATAAGMVSGAPSFVERAATAVAVAGAAIMVAVAGPSMAPEPPAETPGAIEAPGPEAVPSAPAIIEPIADGAAKLEVPVAVPEVPLEGADPGLLLSNPTSALVEPVDEILDGTTNRVRDTVTDLTAVVDRLLRR